MFSTSCAIVVGMAGIGMVSLVEAARVLGVGAEQVRRYIACGLLPAAKIAHVWVLPAADVYALAEAPPRTGRPLAQETAWRIIIGGDIDLEDPHRYTKWGSMRRYTAGTGMIADLLANPDVVVSGAHAAPSYVDLLAPLADEAQVYISAGGLLDDTAAASGLAAYPLGRVQLRAVSSACWDVLRARSVPAAVPHPTLPAGMLCAPPAAVVLDLWCSPHPREQRLAEEIANNFL